MKNFLIAVFAATGAMPAFAGSVQSNICIGNMSASPHLIAVTGVDNYDWDGDSRPDNNFNQVSIPASGVLCQREEINSHANFVNFNFLVDGRAVSMHADSSNFEWQSNNNFFLYGSPPLENGYSFGMPCNSGDNCRQFTILAAPPVVLGSYLHSCRNVSYDPSSLILSAQCLNDQRQYVNTSLNYQICSLRGTVSNFHGVLVCNR